MAPVLLARGAHARWPAIPPSPGPCSGSLDRLDAEMSAQVAALAGDGPTADELRRYKKASRATRQLHRTVCCLLPRAGWTAAEVRW